MKPERMAQLLLIIGSIQLSSAIYFLSRVLTDERAVFSYFGLFVIFMLNVCVSQLSNKRALWQRLIILASGASFTILSVSSVDNPISPSLGFWLWFSTTGVVLSNITFALEQVLINKGEKNDKS